MYCFKLLSHKTDISGRYATFSSGLSYLANKLMFSGDAHPIV